VGNDLSESIWQTNDGGYIVAGSTAGDVIGFHGGADDIWVVKLDAIGGTEWQKALGGNGSDVVGEIQQTTDGGYILVGTTSSNNGDISGNHGSADCWVVKLDALGVIEWQHALGGSAADGAYAVEEAQDGGFVLAGVSSSTDHDVIGNHGGADAWVVKLDSEGETEWQHCYGGSSSDAIFDLDLIGNEAIIITGYTASSDGDVIAMQGLQDFWVVNLDAGGVLQWQSTFGGSGYELATSLSIANDGGYFVTGWTGSDDGDVDDPHGGLDVWVVKLDATGSLVWQRALGGSEDDGAYAVTAMEDGGCLLAGYTTSNDGDVLTLNGPSDAWLIRLSAAGDLTWQRSLGGSGGESIGDIAATAEGGFVVAASSSSNDGDVNGNHGAVDYWVVKLSNEITGIEELEQVSGLVLFPNPAAESITVELDLGHPFPMEFRWFDSAGKFLRVEQQLTLPAGHHRIPFDIHAFAPGLYQLRVEIDGRSLVRVVVVN